MTNTANRKSPIEKAARRPRTIGHQLLSGAEYQRLTALHKALREKDQAPFVVRTEGQTRANETNWKVGRSSIDHLMELGKKDLQIQRYKGLGEMNPEQLWETTMDPEKRTLLQVRSMTKSLPTTSSRF